MLRVNTAEKERGRKNYLNQCLWFIRQKYKSLFRSNIRVFPNVCWVFFLSFVSFGPSYSLPLFSVCSACFHSSKYPNIVLNHHKNSLIACYVYIFIWLYERLVVAAVVVLVIIIAWCRFHFADGMLKCNKK